MENIKTGKGFNTIVKLNKKLVFLILGVLLLITAIISAVIFFNLKSSSSVDANLSEQKLTNTTGDFVGLLYKDPTNAVKTEPVYKDTSFLKQTYKLARIANNTKLQGVDLSGFDLYIGINDVPAAQIGHIDNNNYVYYLQKEDNPKVYLLTYPNFSLEDQLQTNIDKTLLKDATATAAFIRQLTDPLYDLWSNRNPVKDGAVKSDKGERYFNAFFSPILAETSKLTQIDSIKGVPVYTSTDPGLKGGTFYKANDGMLYELAYMPWFLNDDQTLGFAVNGIKPPYNYSYFQDNSCVTAKINEVTINESELKILAKDSKGHNIYTLADPTRQEFKNLYNNFYGEYPIHAEVFSGTKTTNFTANVATLLPTQKLPTLDEFIASNPLLYVQDSNSARFVLIIPSTRVGECMSPTYIYSPKEQDLKMTVNTTAKLTFTEPQVDNSATWDLKVGPGGQIFSKSNQTLYNFLRWESSTVPDLKLPAQGFVVAKSELQEKLQGFASSYGLSSAESKDFVTFWTWKLAQDPAPYYYITFLFNKQVDQIVKFEYSVQPDHENKIFLLYKPLSKQVQVPELPFEKANREGFYVVDWAGGKI